MLQTNTNGMEARAVGVVPRHDGRTADTAVQLQQAVLLPSEQTAAEGAGGSDNELMDQDCLDVEDDNYNTSDPLTVNSAVTGNPLVDQSIMCSALSGNKKKLDSGGEGSVFALVPLPHILSSLAGGDQQLMQQIETATMQHVLKVYADSDLVQGAGRLGSNLIKSLKICPQELTASNLRGLSNREYTSPAGLPSLAMTV